MNAGLESRDCRLGLKEQMILRSRQGFIRNIERQLSMKSKDQTLVYYGSDESMDMLLFQHIVLGHF